MGKLTHQLSHRISPKPIWPRQLVKVEGEGMQVQVKVIKVPAGEAPEEVRREWLGLVLPTRDEQCSEREIDVATLRNIPPRQHLHVSARVAIETLAKTSPEAADWFRRRVPLDVDLNFGRDEVEIVG